MASAAPWPAARLAPGITRLTLPLSFGPRHVHCYLLGDAPPFVLVDAGPATPDAEAALDAALAGAGAPPGAVRRVVLTHYHVDHSGQAYRLARQGAEIGLHERDVPLLESFGEPRGARLAAFVRLLGRLGMPPADCEAAGGGVARLRSLARPAPVTRALRDGLPLEAGGHRWVVVETPGHTPGHVGLLDADGVLIGGDLLVGDGPPYVALQPGGDPDPVAGALASLARLTATGVRRCLPGHGEPVEGEGRAAAAAAALRAACEETAAALRPEPETPYTLLLRQDGRPRSPFHRQVAMLALAARLAYLAAEGRAEALAEGDVLRYRAFGRR